MIRQKIVKSVLNKQKKRDSWFLDEYSVNPYEGCRCNCLYCYIRGSKYGENIENGISIKQNALEVLDKQLANRAKKNQYGFVALGSATDAYMAIEKEIGLSQGFLRLFLKHRFPVFISTKMELIRRDIALLREINQQAILPEDLRGKLSGGTILSISLSTLDEKISDILEAAAAKSMKRLETLKALKEEGFFVGVNAIPMLPYISDTDEALEKIISASRDYGADYILIGSMTLFGEDRSDSRTLLYKFLERYDPGLISKYDRLYNGKFYVPRSYQEALSTRANQICAKYQIRNRILA